MISIPPWSTMIRKNDVLEFAEQYPIGLNVYLPEF